MTPKINNRPWKTIVLAATIIVLGFSPVGQTIYNDCKYFFTARKIERQNNDEKRKQGLLVERYSRLNSSNELALPSAENQVIRIQYKAIDPNRIGVIFEIHPYTKYKGNGGQISVRFLDSDRFCFFSFNVPDDDIYQILDGSGETIGGRYEASVRVPLFELDRLESFQVQAKLSELRLAQLSGRFQQDYTDSLLGLEWSVNVSSSEMTFKQAQIYASRFYEEGWRLPTKKELERIPPRAFNSQRHGALMSGTEIPPQGYYVMNLRNGYVHNGGGYSAYVRLVREIPNNNK